tara:strand:+ start:2410 stop:3198 length:789 start_codon:yes stop_codon:yes gene_type:complete
VGQSSRNIEQVLRFLGQKKDFGVKEFFFDELSREEILSVAARETVVASPNKSESVIPELNELSDQEDFSVSSTATDLSVLDYQELKAVAEGCQLCGLSKTRTNVVFSDGSPKAGVMVVGEAPGSNEDRTGLPFVGRAGKLLDLLLASVNLSREDSVYICNVLKCRPPGNRNPMTNEIDFCAPYLKRQIALVAPEVILAVGTFAAQLLTGNNKSLGELRGSVYSYEDVPLVVTYHPAALLRNPMWTRSSWEDLQILRHVMDEI